MSLRDRIRFGVKKTARAAFGLVGPAWVGAAERIQPRVLTYHRFGEVPNDSFCLSPRAFERQVRWIADSGRAVSLARLCDWMKTGEPLPDGALLVTIDDGHRSTHRDALPILRDHGVPAVAFVTSELVSKGDLAGRMPEPYMDWDEVGALSSAGIEVGSHAANHRSVGCLPREQAFDELDHSRRTLEDRTGVSVRAFAYPFGTRIDCTPETARLAEQVGYECAFTSQHGPIRRDLDRFLLPRIKIEAGEGDWHFRRACRGAMDPWRIVDGLMWRLQQDRTETLSDA